MITAMLQRAIFLFNKREKTVMQKQFEAAMMEVIVLNESDVIATSIVQDTDDSWGELIY